MKNNPVLSLALGSITVNLFFVCFKLSDISSKLSEIIELLKSIAG